MKKNIRPIGNDIKRLRALGYSYRQIVKELNCSPASCWYHLNPHGKSRSLQRGQALRARRCTLIAKIHTFFRDIPLSKPKPNKYSIKRIIRNKLATFNKGYTMKDFKFNRDDLLARLGDEPKCYLTGRPLDLSKSRSYELDHIIPRSKGGENSLENCGVACRDANQSKRDMLLEEYFQLCKEVLEHNGYKVTKDT